MGFSGSVRFRYLALHYSKISETLITGFTCPPTIYFKFITKCDSFFYYKLRWSVITKCDSFFYYKVLQVLLQSAKGITKCDNFITKCDRYYKVRRLLQSATVQGFYAQLFNMTTRQITQLNSQKNSMFLTTWKPTKAICAKHGMLSTS